MMHIPVISRESPRIRMTVDWGEGRPLGAIGLYVKRIGEPQEFAVYPPLDEKGGILEFQFDELLFVKKKGRFLGDLKIGANSYGKVELEYRDDIKILNVENTNV
jgi:hypothetical protein